MDDPFSIPITLYRHCGYSMPISLQDGKGAPYPTEGYIFRLEIVPSAFDRSWASPATFAAQLIAGSGSSGVTFILSDVDTASLDYKTSYTWRVLTSAPGGSAPGGSAPSALVGGSCQVLDGPAMPEVNPV